MEQEVEATASARRSARKRKPVTTATYVTDDDDEHSFVSLSACGESSYSPKLNKMEGTYGEGFVAKYKSHLAEKARIKRMCMSAEQRKVYNEKCKIRQRIYRANKRQRDAAKPRQVLTGKEQEIQQQQKLEKQVYWREMKRKSRERAKKRLGAKQMEDKAPASSDLATTEIAVFTENAGENAVRKVPNVLPKDSSKWANFTYSFRTNMTKKRKLYSDDGDDHDDNKRRRGQFISANALRQRAYRERIKNRTAEARRELRKKENERSQQYREKQKLLVEMGDLSALQMKEKQKESAKIRSKKYRDKRKAMGIPVGIKTKPKSKVDQEAQREYWRVKKEESRKKRQMDVINGRMCNEKGPPVNREYNDKDPVPVVLIATKRLTKRTDVRHRRQRTLPKDFLDPETLTDLEDENPTNQRQGDEPEWLHDADIKREIMDNDTTTNMAGGDMAINAGSIPQNLLEGQMVTATNLNSVSAQSSRHECSQSQHFSDNVDSDDCLVQVKSEPDDSSQGDLDHLELEDSDLGTLVVIRTDPVDSSYDPDQWSGTTGESITGHGSLHEVSTEREQSPSLTSTTRAAKNQQLSDMEESSSNNPLETENDRLKAKMAWLERASAEKDSELEASHRQIVALKAKLRSQQDAMVDLIEDFSVAHEHFRKLTNKFTSALSVLSQDEICEDEVGFLCQNNNNDARDGDTSMDRPGSHSQGCRKHGKV